MQPRGCAEIDSAEGAQGQVYGSGSVVMGTGLGVLGLVAWARRKPVARQAMQLTSAHTIKMSLEFMFTFMSSFRSGSIVLRDAEEGAEAAGPLPVSAATDSASGTAYFRLNSGFAYLLMPTTTDSPASIANCAA